MKKKKARATPWMPDCMTAVWPGSWTMLHLVCVWLAACLALQRQIILSGLRWLWTNISRACFQFQTRKRDGGRAVCVWLPWGQQRWRTQTGVWSPRPRSHCPACLGAPGRPLLQLNAWRRLWCMAPPGTEMPACPLGEHRNRRLPTCSV